MKRKSQLGASEGRLPFPPNMKIMISLALSCLNCVLNPCHHTLKYPPICQKTKISRRVQQDLVYCSLKSLIVKMSGPTLSRSETDELKQRHESLRYAHKNMLHTVQVVQQERDALQQTNRQYAQELSELKWQMQQLQIQMNQQRPVVQPSSSVIPVHQPRPYQPVPAPLSW